MDEKLLAPCGIYCANCPNLKREKTPYCSGCGYHKGHPFWGDCLLYPCAAEHNVEHCGLYADFPCDLFMGHFEGAPDSIEGQKKTVIRVGLLTLRRRAGTERYLEMVNWIEQ